MEVGRQCGTSVVMLGRSVMIFVPFSHMFKSHCS